MLNMWVWFSRVGLLQRWMMAESSGDIFYIAPGHDSWVVGEEPLRVAASDGRQRLCDQQTHDNKVADHGSPRYRDRMLSPFGSTLRPFVTGRRRVVTLTCLLLMTRLPRSPRWLGPLGIQRSRQRSLCGLTPMISPVASFAYFGAFDAVKR
jgi:hypothetical protein